MVKPRRKSRIGPMLFGVALAAMGALTVHWGVLIWRHERTGVDEQEHALAVAAQGEAGRLGQRRQPPALGRVPGVANLEVVRVPPTGRVPRGVTRAAPLHPQFGVRPSRRALGRLQERRRRRVVMLVGEGSLAMLLLGVLCVLLLRVWRLERQRRQEIEAFISTVSHELKTPLAGIKALLGTVQMGYVPADRLGEYTEMGLREVDRLEHLVENLLIANRIRRSALEVRLEPVSLEAFLGGFRRHREALLPDGHAGLAIDEAQARELWALADEDKLRVILENLTDNAIKYGGEGEVRISVRAPEDLVVVDVEDDGVGFEPEVADSLFEGVRENTGSAGALVHGTGLGLGIARDLARAMHGEITAHSTGPGRGSRFSVTLPRTSAPADAKEIDP